MEIIAPGSVWGSRGNQRKDFPAPSDLLGGFRGLPGISSEHSFLLLSSIHTLICCRIPLSVHSFRALSSLSISALMVATSPRKSMMILPFLVVILLVLTCGAIIPYRVTRQRQNCHRKNGEQNRAVKPHHFPPYLAQILPQEGVSDLSRLPQVPSDKDCLKLGCPDLV